MFAFISCLICANLARRIAFTLTPKAFYLPDGGKIVMRSHKLGSYWRLRRCTLATCQLSTTSFSLSGDTVGSRHSPFIEKVGFGASGENKADVSSGPMPVLEESCSKPFIMLLALDGNDSVERYSESLIAAIRVKLDLVKAVASDVALQHLASSHLASVDGCRNNPP